MAPRSQLLLLLRGPRIAQNCSRICQNGPKISENSPKIVRNSSKMAQDDHYCYCYCNCNCVFLSSVIPFLVLVIFAAFVLQLRTNGGDPLSYVP